MKKLWILLAVVALPLLLSASGIAADPCLHLPEYITSITPIPAKPGNHELACSNCGETVEAPCVFDRYLAEADGHTAQCECGNVTGEKQAHTGVWNFEGMQHWTECSVCEYKMTKNAGHVFGHRYDDTHHWYGCSACARGQDGKTAHTFGQTYDSYGHWYGCQVSFCNWGREDLVSHTLETKYDADGHWNE